MVYDLGPFPFSCGLVASLMCQRRQDELHLFSSLLRKSLSIDLTVDPGAVCYLTLPIRDTIAEDTFIHVSYNGTTEFTHICKSWSRPMAQPPSSSHQSGANPTHPATQQWLSVPLDTTESPPSFNSHDCVLVLIREFYSCQKMKCFPIIPLKISLEFLFEVTWEPLSQVLW